MSLEFTDHEIALRIETLSVEQKPCGCRIIVTRVYRELKHRQIPEIAAFNTATIIFRTHHPEIGINDARFTVAEWFDGIA